MGDKPKLPTEEKYAKWRKWTSDYYKLNINPDSPDFVLAVGFELLPNPPRSFKEDYPILDRELTAVNLELFGLAWCSHFISGALSKELTDDEMETALCGEVWYSKSHLESEIWRAAGFYNDVMLKAALEQEASRDWSTPRNFPWDVVFRPGSHVSKEQNDLLELYRAMFGRFLGPDFDNECLTRLVTRCMSKDQWADGVMIQQRLCIALAQRLGLAPRLETFCLLQRVIVGLYRNADNYMATVGEYGSWDLAMKANDALLQQIVRSVDPGSTSTASELL